MKTRQLNKLAPTFVRKVKYDDPDNPKNGKKAVNKHTDGGGLYLLVTKDGRKYWRMDYTRPLSGKRNTLAFGVFDIVTLEMARDKRINARRLLEDDIDPAEHREQKKQQLLYEQSDIFEPLAREWLALRAHENKQDDEVIRRLEHDVFPYVGDKPVRSFTTIMLEKEVTDRIVMRGALTVAKKVKSSLFMIFELARKRKRISENPAEDISLPNPVKGNFPALVDPVQIAPMIQAIWSYEYRPRVYICTAQALKLSTLIFLRPGEIRTLRWSSYNRKEKILELEITLSQGNGAKIAHIVPLSRQAIEILESLYPLTGSTDYVFYSPRGSEPYLSENTVNNALHILGYGGEQTAHGLRATARTVIDERLDFRPDWIEHQLSHVVKDTNGTAYNRTKHIKQRFEMMQRWADYLDSLRTSEPMPVSQVEPT